MLNYIHRRCGSCFVWFYSSAPFLLLQRRRWRMRSKPGSDPVQECSGGIPPELCDNSSIRDLSSSSGLTLHLPSQKEGSGTLLQIQATVLPHHHFYKSKQKKSAQPKFSASGGGQGPAL